MAQAGVYAPGVVIAAEVEVRVDGVLRPHVSMGWAGDTTGGLPAQVVSAGTGMKSRTGTIRWAQEDVQTEPPHPLRRRDGWPPREGDEVVIDATVDTGQGPYTFRRFTGRLGRTTGSLVDGTLTSEITDMLGDALSVPVSIAPTAGVYQARSIWTAHGAIEAAGLGLLPPWGEDGVVLAFHGQGGAAPVVGTGISQINYADQWGNARYEPTGEGRGARAALALARGGVGTARTEITLITTTATLVLGFEAATRALDLSVGGSQVWTGTLGETGDMPLLGLLVPPSGAGIRVFTSPHNYVTVPASIPSGWAVTGMSCLTGRIASMQVRYVSTAEAAPIVARTPTALPIIQRSGLERVRLPATRGVENVSARQVVDAWSEATLGSVWMDEHGRVQMIARDRLLERSPSRVVQVGERVFGGSWAIGHDSVYSRVVVSCEQASVESRSTNKVLIYQERSTRTAEGAEVFERFIEAPPEEEWGPIDLTASRWQGNSAVRGTLPATGTWIHAVVVHDSAGYDEDHWAWDNAPNPSIYDIVIERLGQRTLKVTETVTPGSGVEAVYLKSPERKDNQHPGWIRSAYRDIPSPIIRGLWKSTWADYTVSGASRGPAWAPALEHDAGWWLTPADAQRVADALAAEVTQPSVTLSSVSLLWDPTRQIGDVEEWIATDAEGEESWRATVLVSGYSESWDGSVPTQSVDVRVISMTDPTTGKTYGDLAAAYSTYAGITGTYQQVYDALPGAR